MIRFFTPLVVPLALVLPAFGQSANEDAAIEAALAELEAVVDDVKDIKLSNNPELKRLNERIERNPKDAVAFFYRARFWEDKGDYDKVIADCTSAIRLDYGDPLAYRYRAAARLHKNDYDKAVADCDYIIRLNPNDVIAYGYRGLAWSNKGDYDKAIADFNKAIRLDPSARTNHFNRGVALIGNGDYDKAISDFNEAIRQFGDDKAAYYQRGLAWSNKGDYDKAIADFSKAIRLDPSLALFYVDRGLTWAAKEDFDWAVADYEEAIRLIPKYAYAYVLRGRAWGGKKDYDRAIADYEKAIRLDSKYWFPYHNLGWLYSTCSKSSFRNGYEAVRLANKAIELAEGKEVESVCLMTLSAAYAETGKYGAAIDTLDESNALSTGTDKDLRDRMRQAYLEKRPFIANVETRTEVRSTRTSKNEEEESATKWVVEDFGKSMAAETMKTYAKRMVGEDNENAAKAFADAIGTLPTFDDVRKIAEANKTGSQRFSDRVNTYGIRAWVAANAELTIDGKDGSPINPSSLKQNLGLTNRQVADATVFYEKFKVAYAATMQRIKSLGDLALEAHDDAVARKRLKERIKGLEREDVDAWINAELVKGTEKGRRKALTIRELLSETD